MLLGWQKLNKLLQKSYRAFHTFGQAKFPDVGSIFSIAPSASKNTAQSKSGQNQSKNNHLALLI